MKSRRNKASLKGKNNTSVKNKHQQPTIQTDLLEPNQKARNSRKTPGPPILFFKDDEQPYGFLCQWYRSRFTDPESGLEFSCTEQWMMWNTAQLAHDEETATQIMHTTSSRKQKQLGRDVVGFDASAWDKIKSDVVEQGNYLKFTQATNAVSMKMDDVGDPVPLRDLLLATGQRELVEASKFDRVWGIGFDAQQAPSTPRDRWGQNLLGEALMSVRERVRAETEE